ncbi:hypothetical protein KUTeg_016689 [Tegillarca granosa]|uniref:Spermatogenesis-associated protein 6 N-terminal domain-containing protein n=1 Tax=Tegillarca granosa TaxID=220873 RepID=A0ABQ9ELN8_TEGGR|nr:hypothetical protein KUTeg_016689 [Tegillarca granosa]
MPRRALRCLVDLNIKAVSAPGVWLPSREDVYLSISVLGQYRNTKLLRAIFPLYFNERFIFEKVFYSALDPSEVVEYLEDDLVVFELLQLDSFGGAVRLASYSTNARDFLFPYPTLAPVYCSPGREILLGRTINFPGIAPKLEFTTTTTINESRTPEIDALDDALKEERRSRSRQRSRSRSRSRPRSRSAARTYITVDSDEDLKNYHRPTVSSVFRSRSASPYTRHRSCSVDERPPFVVRRLNEDLIGRVPGYETEKSKKAVKKKGKRSSSRPRSALSDRYDSGGYDSDYSSYPSLRRKYYISKVLRDSADPLPVYGSRYVSDEDDDAEVAALTSSLNNYYIRPRSRSPSPLLYRSSYKDRYLDSPLTASERVELRVQDALRRSRSRSKSIEDLARSVSPISGSLPPLRYYRNSLDDLEIDTRIAESRSQVHLNNGKYWTQKAAQLSAKPHREVFNDNLSTLYSRLYKNAKKMV